MAGIRAWRDHPWRRDLPDPPIIWREETARLLDFGGSGPPVLFVPSLINRWTVLDLMRDHSMMRWLASRGVHPLLLDWGAPEPAFSLTDHIAGRLVRAMEAVGERHVLAGYCMGGTFAVAAAALRPDLINGLLLLAAPWDFHAGDAGSQTNLAIVRHYFTPLLAHSGTLPVDALQMLFALENPSAIAEKFRRFGRQDQNSAEAHFFVALEDWLNDGLPLSGTVARECIRDWYQENLPNRGAWRITGLPIDPTSIKAPALVAIPGRDRIVPPASSQALAHALPNATVLKIASGHVGMTAGRSAPKLLWEPVRAFIESVKPPKPSRIRTARRQNSPEVPG